MFNAKVYTVMIPSSGVALEEHIAREVRMGRTDVSDLSPAIPLLSLVGCWSSMALAFSPQ